MELVSHVGHVRSFHAKHRRSCMPWFNEMGAGAPGVKTCRRNRLRHAALYKSEKFEAEVSGVFSKSFGRLRGRL